MKTKANKKPGPVIGVGGDRTQTEHDRTTVSHTTVTVMSSAGGCTTTDEGWQNTGDGGGNPTQTKYGCAGLRNDDEEKSTSEILLMTVAGLGACMLFNGIVLIATVAWEIISTLTTLSPCRREGVRRVGIVCLHTLDATFKRVLKYLT